MRLFFATVILLVLSYPVFSQSESTYVVLEPQGHTGTIGNIFFSPTGEELVSVSEDRTIKVWNSETGYLMRTLRGQMGSGSQGVLNAGAIHPNSLVAVGGLIGGQESGLYDIRLMNIYTGKMSRTFQGLNSPVVSLAFSNGGNLMAAGTLSGQIVIFDLKTEQTTMYTRHNASIKCLIFSSDDQQLVSASNDGKLIMWDLSLRNTGSQAASKELKSHTGSVNSVAFSPDGKYILSGGSDNRIVQWDSKGNFVKELVRISDDEFGDQFGLGDIHSLAFTGDGSMVVAGTQLMNNENARVYSVPDGNLVSTIKIHDSPVFAAAAYGNDLVATAGGEERDIVLWNPNTGKVHKHITSHGKSVYSIATSADGRIAFGQTRKEVPLLNDRGNLEKVFDLNILDIRPFSNAGDFRTVLNEYNGVTFSLQGNTFAWSNGEKVEIPGSFGEPLCATFTTTGKFVVGTTLKILVFDQFANLEKVLDGHQGEVNAISPSHDGRYIYSASADQTVNIWDLNRGTAPLARLFVSKDNDWVIWTDKHYYATSQNGSGHIGFHINNGKDNEATFYGFEQFDLVFNRADEVLGALGSKNISLIQTHYQAFKKRIEKLGLDEFGLQKSLVAPELRLTIPETHVNYELLDLNFSATASPEAFLSSIHININDVPIMGSAGLPANLRNREAKMVSSNITVTLNPGDNYIEMYVRDENGIMSNKEVIYVNYKPTKSVGRPNLYFYGIGVSEYKDGKMELDYAAKDARDLASMFAKMKFQFNEVKIKTITNENVTYPKVMEIKSELDKTAAMDFVIIYVGGHSIIDENYNYYMGTYEVDFSDPSRGGILYDDIEDIMDGIPARNKVLLIDACHSGEVDGQSADLLEIAAGNRRGIRSKVFKNKGGDDTTLGLSNSYELMKDRFADMRKSNGTTVISSAAGAEYAIVEGQWKNGVFAYALIDGLSTRKADLNHDGKVLISELQRYIYQTIEDLTDGNQKPTSRLENLKNDFVIWR